MEIPLIFYVFEIWMVISFYDQYLKVYPHLNTLALAFECQIVEDITAEDHDIDPQLVVTESQIFYQKKE